MLGKQYLQYSKGYGSRKRYNTERTLKQEKNSFTVSTSLDVHQAEAPECTEQEHNTISLSTKPILTAEDEQEYISDIKVKLEMLRYLAKWQSFYLTFFISIACIRFPLQTCWGCSYSSMRGWCRRCGSIPAPPPTSARTVSHASIPSNTTSSIHQRCTGSEQSSSLSAHAVCRCWSLEVQVDPCPEWRP